MMMTISTAAASSKTEELEKPNESLNSMETEEKVDLDGDKDPEETIQEEIEYEEVKEEVEEEVDEDEEIQEVEELEVEEEEDEDEYDNEIDMKESNEDDKKKHGELLTFPPHGSQVYLDGIPFTDEDLRSLGQSVGEVTEVRTFDRKHRSYGFITFRTKELASKAIEKFNNAELKGKTIRCSSWVAKKNKLFIGNIPKSWGEEDLREVVTEVGPGVITIEHLKDPLNSSHNRGYAFVEYYNHACADYSRLKMSNPNFKLGDNSPTVSWANPKSVESSAAFQGKVMCVKYLPKHVSQDTLKELFGQHGKITEVVLPSAEDGQWKNRFRFAFVHFAENSSAMSAVNPTKNYKIDGIILRCSLAEPQTDCGVNSQKSPLLPGHPPRVGYGRVGGAYAAVGGEFGALGLTQEEKVDLDGDKDPEETIQEEIEYEEVEEEVEEEVDEEEKIQEDEVEVEEEEDEDDNEIDMKESNEDDKKKHGELLALPPHGHGSQVFLDGLPFTTDEALRSLGQSVGEVTQVRIINRKHCGYAFITFRTKELASKFVEMFNNTELEGKTIRCYLFSAKNKLFIGNIPKSWGEEDLREVVTEVGPGVITIEHLKDPQNSSHNRGYAFVEYYNHACADYSRLKMSNPNFKLGDNSPTVSWANPKSAESSAAFQGKVICVKYRLKHVSEDKLKELFGHHGKITEVVLPSAKDGQGKSGFRFAFVHFAENSSAMSAVNPTKPYKVDGKILHCSLAEPQTDCGVNSQKSPLLLGHPPQVGYGRVGGAYAAVGGEFGALGLTQPLLLPDAAATGVPMMPMLLPDGRIGYVFKQPGIHAHTHILPSQCRAGSSNGGERSNEGGQGREQYNLGVCRKIQKPKTKKRNLKIK